IEAQLPTPISQPLFDAELPTPSSPPFGEVPTPAFPLYPDSLAVFPTATAEAVSVTHLEARPARGRVFVAPSVAVPVRVTDHYGFSSTIGAGPYDRRLGRSAPPTPHPQPP